MDKPGDWSQGADITFIEADNGAALLPAINQSKKYVQLYNAANPNDKIVGYHFQPLKSMNFHAYKVNNQRFNQTNIAGYIMLLVIAIATLLLKFTS